ncbi:MAG: hypothetical protein WC426_01405 [Sulfuriferula sp.]
MTKLIAALFLILLASHAAANPAAWYQWRSKLNGDLVCRQTSPGPGWEKTTGPYHDSHCEHLARYQ